MLQKLFGSDKAKAMEWEDNSGLPTGPLTITQTLKYFFDNVLMDYQMFSLLLYN